MNWSKMSFGALCVGSLIAYIVHRKAESHYETESNEKALTERNAFENAELLEAQETVDIVDKLRRRESTTLTEENRKWKKANDYDVKLRDIHAAAVVDMDTFKNSINYNERKRQIEDAALDELDAYKDSIDYDSEIDSLEDEIEDAENMYKQQCRLFDISSDFVSNDKVSDTVKKLKEAEKENRDDRIKAAKSEIKKLESDVKAQEAKINKKKQDLLRELDKELAPTRIQIEKAEQEASSKIRGEFHKAEDNFRAAIQQNRSDEEKEALERYDDSKRTIARIMQNDSDRALKLYQNTPAYEKWAAYFKSINCPKWFVAGVGSIPMAAIAYIGYEYGKFMYMTLKSM